MKVDCVIRKLKGVGFLAENGWFGSVKKAQKD